MILLAASAKPSLNLLRKFVVVDGTRRGQRYGLLIPRPVLEGVCLDLDTVGGGGDEIEGLVARYEKCSSFEGAGIKRDWRRGQLRMFWPIWRDELDRSMVHLAIIIHVDGKHCGPITNRGVRMQGQDFSLP